MDHTFWTSSVATDEKKIAGDVGREEKVEVEEFTRVSGWQVRGRHGQAVAPRLPVRAPTRRATCNFIPSGHPSPPPGSLRSLRHMSCAVSTLNVSCAVSAPSSCHFRKPHWQTASGLTPTQHFPSRAHDISPTSDDLYWSPPLTGDDYLGHERSLSTFNKPLSRVRVHYPLQTLSLLERAIYTITITPIPFSADSQEYFAQYHESICFCT